MKILITSGGTREKIDEVRSIANHASGSLGKLIAEKFLTHGHEVTLVTTKSAVKPNKHAKLSLIEITDVSSLIQTLKPLVKSHDLFIHSMAVSDYTPVYMTDLDEAKQAKDLTKLLMKENQEQKISSAAEYQVLFLKKTPKVISLVKQWNPQIRLIGFKLLVGVPKDELFAAATKSLINNQADYILANDLSEITADTHHAFLLNQNERYEAFTKPEIAQLIYEKGVEHD
ncbi:phosphopantothenate--cysteine ligase [Streptococcus chenjunshii]|uniref:Phosphopantothenate--cysteine ligase n=1 Tax=Streptococcus chenjunshii TaxID=2173853 RepID=A0A372KPW9_9STRE|nr:phosphopantothenate--cysteine ligase [Streptococcus chenjunshii]AXQ79737.1 phosphopantothenate--cysteine ligase [Streptococcus chenjunshii]RFU51740.1 phosphopantothenate--cysteine ligase [Streptococcus chenjunshii]RFU54301.1 phosphopantothenate--cysteine ligase [Streptococcus chenjunshii]